MGIMDIMEMAINIAEYANDKEFFIFFLFFDKIIRTGFLDKLVSDDDIKNFNIDSFTDRLNHMLSEIGDDEECGTEEFVRLRRGY